MAKVTGPLLSLDASGSVANTMTFSRWKGINYVRQRVIPTYTNTEDQKAIRKLIRDLAQGWKTGDTDGASTEIDSEYKDDYKDAVSGLAMSGFDLFIRDGVAKNGGSSYTGTVVYPTQPGDQS